MLLSVPELFTSQHGGERKAQLLFLRGFDAVHGQDLELTVGGLPVNEVSNIHGQGYADLHFVIPEVVRALRIRPGPFDPRQGDFASAGSLDFSLGYDAEEIAARASAGAFGALRTLLVFRHAGQLPETLGAMDAMTTDGFGTGRVAKRATALGLALVPLSDSLHLRVLAGAYAGRFGSASVLRLDDLSRVTIDRFGSYDSRQGGTSSRAQLLLELTQRLEKGARSIAA